MATGSSGATIRRHVASIGSIYKLSGKEDISKGPAVLLAMKRMYRRKGRASARPRRSPGMCWKHCWQFAVTTGEA
jgi:hypothetical protein